MADALAKGKRPKTSGPGGEDAFTDAIVGLWAWVRNNLRTFLVALAALALAALGVWYYVNFQTTVREQAAADLATLRLGATSAETAIPDLESYIARYDGTEAADEARLLLARTYLDTGDPVEAIRVAEEIGVPVDRPVGYAAANLRAVAQRASGDAQAALATLQSLGGRARFAFQRREAQAAAAQILADLGRVEEAVAIYRTIAEEAEREDPAEAGVYRLRLGELRGRVTGPGASGG